MATDQPSFVPPETTSSPPDSSQPTPSQTVPSAGTSPGIMNKKPEMADLQRHVIPKIMNHWEQIAEALRYENSIIESIKQKEREDPKKCCREFLKDWLNSNRGTGPKVWSTLINILKDPDLELIEASTMEEIIAKVKQLK